MALTLIIRLAWLLFAHLLADYPLQGQFLAEQKGKNPIALVSHAGIWTGTITLAALLLHVAVSPWMVVCLFAVHAFADWLKASRRLWYARLDPLGWGLLVDQLAHVVQIVVLLVA